jgi:hypothetical protein
LRGGAPGDLVERRSNRSTPSSARHVSLGGVSGSQVGIVFDKRCADASVLNRLETSRPPPTARRPRGEGRRQEPGDAAKLTI